MNLHSASFQSGKQTAFDAARRDASAIRAGARERNGFNITLVEIGFASVAGAGA
jgi:hypothetical protein